MQGERTVGYCISVQRGAVAHLDSVAVARSARGQRIATRLLMRVIRHSGRQGSRSILLMVRRENAAAIQLYRGLGFERVRRVDRYYEDGAAAWQMRLKL